MNRAELIKKWLDNNLNSEEQKAFEQLDDYNDLIKMDIALKNFKAPETPVEHNYQTLERQLKSKKKNSNQWLKPLLRLAAVLAIGFSVFFYTSKLDTEINTNIAQQKTIALPDNSSVDLNANSLITYNKSNWNEVREVALQGEAFFKVAKGQKFDVITTTGTVSVLGTQFNVKQREAYFEVTCYEGLVAVTQNNKTVKLQPGNTFAIIDGKQIVKTKENTNQPIWQNGESSFSGIALKHVITEFENQYDIKMNTNTIDTSRLFTGSFTHNNLDLALQSITIPLNLSYSKSGKSILLEKRE